MKYERNGRGDEGEKSQTRPNYSAKDLTIKLPEGRESPYRRLDKLTNLS